MIKINKDFNAVIIVSVILIAIGFGLIAGESRSCAFIFLFVSLSVLIMFLILTIKRIRDIRSINDYLNSVSNGDYNLDIKDNRENELSIIKNSLYKIIVTLRSQQELLYKDKNYLSDSLADISHQIKTPITSITMMTDLLKTEDNEEKRHEFLEVINNQLSRVNWLIITLLKLSKIDAKSVQFKNDNENLKKILFACIQPFLLNAELNNIDLSVSCSDDIFVYVDKNWYIEALSNIIKNCIEHTKNGGYVRVSAVKTPIYTKIIISDNGSGISQKDLPHIFERFYQGENHTDSSVGIGLALSKAIFNNQNSVINVNSKENEGTEFEITIYKIIV